MQIFYFKESNFLEVLNTFKDLQTEIVELTDKNSAAYRMCFEPNVYLIRYGNEYIGFINIDIARCPRYNNFIDIWLHPNYRNKGLGYEAYKEFEKTELPKLFKKKKVNNYCISATIDRNNVRSVRLFLKLGFSFVKNANRLRKLGTLGRNEIRLIKCYQV